MDTIGEKIRKLRQRHEWTQQNLADLCSFPGPWTVSRLETRGTDSLSTLEVVCGAFGIAAWELLKPDHLFWNVNETGEELTEAK